MNYVVNGIEKSSPIASERPLQELLEYVRKAYTTETSLIASIKVNGMELDSQDEKVMDGIPLAQIRSFEVFTQHPREMAEETLQMLREFTRHLELVCQDMADAASACEKAAPLALDLSRLVDGVQTFLEGLDTSKRILHISADPTADVLEAELASVFKDILDHRESGDAAYVVELLRNALTQCFTDWREKGIPALIRSRDS